mmetsp:Transcript_17683/g.35256  ORF Transcript_17683/g.35256 Transcript_17683/m.35256 type:complete len:155 (+) Transcript_17683:162-626(+)
MRTPKTMTTFAFALCSLARLPTVRMTSSFIKPHRTLKTSTLRMMSDFNGPRQALIEERLTKAFAPTYLEVKNTSHGRKEDESHFKVVVVSEVFSGTRLVGRHRAVNAALAESDGVLAFHSLEIGATKTPDEWVKNSSVPVSPKCAGGDGRGMGR